MDGSEERKPLECSEVLCRALTNMCEAYIQTALPDEQQHDARVQDALEALGVAQTIVQHYAEDKD